MVEMVNTFTIGEYLRRARQAKNLSLEDVAQRTKIHLRVLEALEDDRAHEHLHPVYIRSFLNMYATLLGEDFAALSQQYSLKAVRSSQAVSVAQRRRVPSRRWPTWSAFAPAQRLGIGVAALAILAVGVARAIPDRPIASGQEIAAPNASVAPAATEPAATTPLVKKGERLHLVVRVRERAWVQVKADGDIVFQQVLNKGAQERWGAVKAFELWLGNAGAVTLELNGHNLGAPGKPGEVVRGVKITHEGLKR